MNDFQKMKLLDDSRAEFKRYCKCGHSIIFPATSKVDKTICSWCGRSIYKNDLAEFKNKLTNILK